MPQKIKAPPPKKSSTTHGTHACEHTFSMDAGTVGHESKSAGSDEALKNGKKRVGNDSPNCQLGLL
jgi:hypothetical protein